MFGGLNEWEISVYFGPLYVLVKTLLDALTNSAIQYSPLIAPRCHIHLRWCFLQLCNMALVSTEILQWGCERNHPTEFSKCHIKRSIVFEALKKISKAQLREIQMVESKQIQSDQYGQSRPETASVAWRRPPGEEVGRVALSQLHQKCMLSEI